MKTILSTLILSFVLISGNAQQLLGKEGKSSENKSVNNYVVLTRNTEQLKPILMAAQQLVKEDEKQFGKFEIIVCGKDVVSLTDESKMKDFLTQAGELKVNIIACGFSLKKFGVNSNEIPKAVKIVENGILYNLELQKRGYFSLEL